MANRLPVSAAIPRPPDPKLGPLHAVLTSLITEILQFLSVKQPWQVARFVVAALPDATEWEGSLIYVTDETGGPTMAFSDGSDWLRIYDNAVVS